MKWVAKLKTLVRGKPEPSAEPEENIMPYAPEPSSSDVERLNSLTRREREVFELLARGKKMREAAEALGVKPTTISFHTTSLYKKLDVRSRTELILRYGLAEVLKDASCKKGVEPQ